MKTVILAGGFGTRITEESYFKPKPMIEIGEQPILWHIMKMYAYYGHNDFIICLGYKANVIKEYFANYYLHTSDVTFDLETNEMKIHRSESEPWKVTLVDTGLNTMTGGRIKRIKDYLNNETFMMTYGDGVSDVDIESLVKYHKEHKKMATITTVNVSQRYGVIDINKDNQITEFREKSEDDSTKINGGFMVLEPDVIDYIEDDTTVFEKKPLENLSNQGQLMSYNHEGFWQCMDTQRDKQVLDKLWNDGNPPWRKWQ